MDDRPAESWTRDALFESPWALLNVLVDVGVIEQLPGQIQSFVEYPVDAGFIDLAIAWPDHIVIVEVKRSLADESAVAQVLRYRGALELRGFENVIAVVAAGGFSRHAAFAAATSGVTLVVVKPAATVESFDSNAAMAERRAVHEDLEHACRPSAAVPPADSVAVIGPRESGEGSHVPR